MPHVMNENGCCEVRAGSSHRRVLANRSNSALSCGPRSELGKAKSALNARSHGIYSRDLLLPHEDPEALEALRLDLLEEFEPLLPSEACLLEQIVAAHWRLRRLWRLEGGVLLAEIRRGETADIAAADRHGAEAYGHALTRDEALGFALSNLGRLEGELGRSFHRSLGALQRMRTALPGTAAKEGD